MIEITMPRLSDTMEEGAILSWQKKPGDRVEIGDVLAEIETDKATMEYEAYEAGTLSKVLVPEGDLVSVGALIALLDDGSGDAPEGGESEGGESEGGDRAAAASEGLASSGGAETATADAPTEAKHGSSAGTGSAAEAPSGTGSETEPEAGSSEDAGEAGEASSQERRFASPLVRKLARENNLDLSSVDGTGPGGRIIRTDIEPLLEHADAGETSSSGVRASGEATGAGGVAGEATDGARVGGASSSTGRAAASGAAVVTGGSDEKRASEAVALSNTRRVIARRLGESARSIPHFYVTAVADAEALVRLRAELNEQLAATGRGKVSVNDLLIRASALALQEHPLVNASYQGDESTTMLVHHRINIGVAVASENGLVVPVIEDADRKSVTQLGAEAKELVGLANEKKLTPGQMSGGTFTISNLGMFGVEEFTAIINPPEGAILAVGGLKREPVVVGDEVVIHSRLRYTLSADHRIIDGALAAQFLQTLTRLVENPWTIIA